MTINETDTTDAFSPLAAQQFVLLKTFRKNGTAVPTQVWFALDHGNIYLTTMRSTGKVKRIRNNGRVTLTPCDRRGNVIGDGTEYAGMARELPESAYPRAHAALSRKYGLMYRVFMFAGSLRKSERTYIEIVPA